MKKKTLVLKLSKSTKGTHVYSNEQLGLSWYMPRAMFEGEPPAELKVTLEDNK